MYLSTFQFIIQTARILLGVYILLRYIRLSVKPMFHRLLITNTTNFEEYHHLGYDAM
jgi:hypothetical protein